ncbi:DUF6864 domain-containing function [Pseudomonas sp. AM4(2022)]|uniref:DUF6864 domain-containing function n=1 Tax=Pseudomonas sp. AM4(2022) TaxID=2983408 RepID=UPI002E7FDFC9|nr:hypothetical protein [Pseudomonas sp. AM4(2022)]
MDKQRSLCSNCQFPVESVINMFSVSCIGSPTGKKLVSHGVILGLEGSSVQFEINVPDIPMPLVVDFMLLDDSSKPPLTVEVNEIVNNSVAVSFFNSIRSGRSGIPEPVSIVGVNNIELQMVFHLERHPQAPSYLLFYSFYEAPAGWGF